MRKMFLFIMLLLPTFAFASVDVSDCEIIGYRDKNVTCVTMERCQQDFQKMKEVVPDDEAKEDFDICVKSIKTPEECAKYVSEQQEMAHREYLIYKCPMTDKLLKLKTQEWRDAGGLEKEAFYNDGTPIDTDSMITDDESVYLFRVQVPFDVLPLDENTKYGYDIIGPANEYGMMFTFIDKE